MPSEAGGRRARSRRGEEFHEVKIEISGPQGCGKGEIHREISKALRGKFPNLEISVSTTNVTTRALERELKEAHEELKHARADRLDVLNNQAEAITELRARCLPEGWVATVLERELVAPKGAKHHVLLRIEELTPDWTGWAWKTFFVDRKGHLSVGRGTSAGHNLSLIRAITEAEKAGKKALR